MNTGRIIVAGVSGLKEVDVKEEKSESNEKAARSEDKDKKKDEFIVGGVDLRDYKKRKNELYRYLLKFHYFSYGVLH